MKLRVIGYDQNDQEVDLTGKVTPMVDGYEFGDTQMEGVMFKININEDRSNFTVDISDQDKDYFEQFNKNFWYKRCRESVLSDLTSGGLDVYEISEEEAEKFGVDTQVDVLNDKGGPLDESITTVKRG